ncbi:MAG: gliding motility-associated C-terminal domain-containing protein, partial [Thermoanaerobaculia bacterium]|nr:gliding motility-associated C-terminal domain-containing protein [Thermoanaerobaculia bacterium]
TFIDNTAPVITCPADKQLNCGESTAPANTGSATATDNCGGTPVITYTDEAIAANCTGKAGVKRTWKATDACDNTATCVQTITFIDNTAPVITCPTDKQLACGESTAPANTGSATATDNCGGTPVITYTDEAIAANCTGKAGVKRTWKATDACDNTATCVQTITFIDNTA